MTTQPMRVILTIETNSAEKLAMLFSAIADEYPQMTEATMSEEYMVTIHFSPAVRFERKDGEFFDWLKNTRRIQQWEVRI